MEISAEPQLIKGGLAADDRGFVSFVNDFNFKDVRRFYMVENHAAGFIRAWHGHKKEGKYVLVVKGSALICAVGVDNWVNPSRHLKIWRFTLTERNPAILYIPAGYANGAMTLSPDAKIMYFSTSELNESLNDDFRFESHFWDPWKIEER
jgi:dTDP-4-dehydrorhamnose 3,5-epimerase